MLINDCRFQKKMYLCNAKQNGSLTEWLGSGLQNRVQQFESAGYLTKKLQSMIVVFLFYSLTMLIYLSIFRRMVKNLCLASV